MDLTVEDGIIENLQVVVLVAAGLVSALVARNLYRQSQPKWSLVYAIAGVAFVGMAGEEISWGQRLLDQPSPDFFGQYNKQGETNLHNLNVVAGVVRHASNVLVLLLIGLSFYSWRISGEKRARWRADLWMPAAILLPIWLCYGSYRWVRLFNSITHVRRTAVLSRLQEPAELIFYTGFFAFALIVLLRLRRQNRLSPELVR